MNVWNQQKENWNKKARWEKTQWPTEDFVFAIEYYPYKVLRKVNCCLTCGRFSLQWSQQSAVYRLLLAAFDRSSKPVREPASSVTHSEQMIKPSIQWERRKSDVTEQQVNQATRNWKRMKSWHPTRKKKVGNLMWQITTLRNIKTHMRNNSLSQCF